MYTCVEKASVGLSTDMNCGSRCPVSHPPPFPFLYSRIMFTPNLPLRDTMLIKITSIKYLVSSGVSMPICKL